MDASVVVIMVKVATDLEKIKLELAIMSEHCLFRFCFNSCSVLNVMYASFMV